MSALEAKVAGLEGAAGGACCFSTGMAATVTVMSAFLKAGERANAFVGMFFFYPTRAFMQLWLSKKSWGDHVCGVLNTRRVVMGYWP